MKQIILFILSLSAFSALSQSFDSYFEEDGLISNSVNCVTIGNTGEVFFGTQFGISHFDGTTWTNFNTDDGLIDNNVLAIFFDNTELLWVGTDFGLNTYDGTDWVTLTEADGLEDDRIKCFYQDSNGLIWIGHNDGVSTYDGTTFINYTSDDGLPFGGVSDVTEDQGGNMWLSNGIFGAIMFDGTDFTLFNEADLLLSNSIRAVAVTASNKKWIGTAEGISVLGANNAHEEDHEIIFVLPPPDELNPVEDVKIDSQGHVWAAVYVDYLVTVGGISLYDSGTWVDYDSDDGLAGPNVRQLAIDAQDGVWVATSTGVTYVSDVTFGMSETSSKEVDMYPNPSTGQITLLLDDSSAVLEVYALTSELVHSEPVKGAYHSMNLSHLSSGVYMLKHGSKSARIIIE